MPVDGARGQGLGAQLIRAFALQLGGPVNVEEGNGRYAVTSRFVASGKDDMAGIDY